MEILFPGWNGRVGLLEITKTYSEIDVLHATRDLCLGFSAHFQHRQTTGFKTNPLTSGQKSGTQWTPARQGPGGRRAEVVGARAWSAGHSQDSSGFSIQTVAPEAAATSRTRKAKA